MNINNLYNLYPNSLLNPKNPTDIKKEEYFLIESLSDQLFIPIKQLDKDEIKILSALFPQSQQTDNGKNSWEKLLDDNIIDPTITTDTIQILYLNNNHLDKEEFKIWKETIMDSIYIILEVIYLNNNLILLILDYSKIDKDILKSLLDVIHSLDQDFSTLTEGMIGQVIQVNEDISSIYFFEKNLFRQSINQRGTDGIIKLSDLLINNLAKLFKESSVNLPKLSSHLTHKNENKSLIQSLFQHEGNLSKTAEDLYIHRNTLSYRINQFRKQTGFNLTYFPDLIVCYLLVS